MVLGEADDDGGVGDLVFEGHFVEHLEGIVGEVNFGVKMDESGGWEGGGGEGELEGESMEVEGREEEGRGRGREGFEEGGEGGGGREGSVAEEGAKEEQGCGWGVGVVGDETVVVRARARVECGHGFERIGFALLL